MFAPLETWTKLMLATSCQAFSADKASACSWGVQVAEVVGDRVGRPVVRKCRSWSLILPEAIDQPTGECAHRSDRLTGARAARAAGGGGQWKGCWSLWNMTDPWVMMNRAIGGPSTGHRRRVAVVRELPNLNFLKWAAHRITKFPGVLFWNPARRSSLVLYSDRK